MIFSFWDWNHEWAWYPHSEDWVEYKTSSDMLSLLRPGVTVWWLEGQMWIYSRCIWVLTAQTTASGGSGSHVATFFQQCGIRVTYKRMKSSSPRMETLAKNFNFEALKADDFKYSETCEVFFHSKKLAWMRYLQHSFAELIIQEMDTKCENCYIMQGVLSSFPGVLQEEPSSILCITVI